MRGCGVGQVLATALQSRAQRAAGGDQVADTVCGSDEANGNARCRTRIMCLARGHEGHQESLVVTKAWAAGLVVLNWATAVVAY